MNRLFGRKFAIGIVACAIIAAGICFAPKSDAKVVAVHQEPIVATHDIGAVAIAPQLDQTVVVAGSEQQKATVTDPAQRFAAAPFEGQSAHPKLPVAKTSDADAKITVIDEQPVVPNPDR